MLDAPEPHVPMWATATRATARGAASARRWLATDDIRAVGRAAAARISQVKEEQLRGAGGSSGGAWPKGLIAGDGVGPLAMLPPDHVCELLYEVGWNARHSYLDVRPAADGAAAVREALRVPFLPEVHTFETRVAAALVGARRPRDPDDDPKAARIVVGCCGAEDGEDSRSAARALQTAGYQNVVALAGGFARWREEGFPTEGDEDDDELADGTL